MLDGGDSAGGNMTAAPSLRLKDQNQQHSLKAQILLYPEAPLPFDTPAAVENNVGRVLLRVQRHLLVRRPLPAARAEGVGGPAESPVRVAGDAAGRGLRGVAARHRVHVRV